MPQNGSHDTAVTSVVREDLESVVSELESDLQCLAGTSLLVTGAAGFLPSYFVDLVALANASLSVPCHIFALDSFITGLPQRLAHLQSCPDVTILRQDLRRPLELPEPVQWIIHGASIASPPFYRRFPLETIDVNVGGTRQLLELSAAGGVASMLHLSTSEVYGDPDPSNIPTNEEYVGHVPFRGPRACYDESKRLAETLCAELHRLRRAPVKTVRIFNVYGPAQRLDDGRIIPDLMSAALRRQPITLFSDGRATRSFCYVRDALRAMLRVFFSNSNGEVFNVGNDTEEKPIGEVAALMCEIADDPQVRVERRVSDDPSYLTDNPQRRCPDLQKLRRAFSYAPTVTLREGLTRTLRSYREAAGA